MNAKLEQELPQARKRAYVAAYRLLGNRAEAQDACQEAVAKALDKRARYDQARPFYPWFHRILKNLCLDKLRARKKLSSLGEQPIADSSLDVETHLGLKERDQAIAESISRLPEELKELIELRHFQDLSYQEMAELLDLPLGTVMSRLYRARKALRELLNKDPRFTEQKEEQR